MRTVRLEMIGRFGNNMFQFAHAKSVAEKNGLELHVEPWVGEKIFTLDGYDQKRPDGKEDIVLKGYFQNQESINYTRADCLRWFQLRPEIKAALDLEHFWNQQLPIAHIRRGDYAGYGYPLVGLTAVVEAMREHGFDGPFDWVSDSIPSAWAGDLDFLPDFYRMMSAKVLFRGNSSFSYWAAVVGSARVFSPVINGLAGGVEHDNVRFVPGNWPALAELPGITDLHLPE